MNLTFGILLFFLVRQIDSFKPKYLKGKYSDDVKVGFVDLPLTPRQALNLGWLRPPEDRFSAHLATFCDTTSPLVCLTYNPNFEIIKMSTIPSVQLGLFSDLLAANRSYRKTRLFGKDVYESTIWFLNPLQLRDNNFTVPDSKYIWGPIQSTITRIEPNAIGMKYVNLMSNLYCYEKMGNHFAANLMDPIHYMTDPYTGELVGWEFDFYGTNGLSQNALLDDTASFLIRKAESALLNKGFSDFIRTVYSAFHVYIVPDPYATTCPKSINAIVRAYDKKRQQDDSNYGRVYRKGGIADPEDLNLYAL